MQTRFAFHILHLALRDVGAGRSPKLRVTVLVLIAIAAGAVEGRAQASCRPVPHYVGQDWIAKGGSRGSAGISLRPADLTLDNLLCLVSTLRREHPEWNDVAVMFFDWREAAQSYRVGWEFSRGVAIVATGPGQCRGIGSVVVRVPA
jgi:hypothetical protein